jgi:hypothetical protein
MIELEELLWMKKSVGWAFCAVEYRCEWSGTGKINLLGNENNESFND